MEQKIHILAAGSGSLSHPVDKAAYLRACVQAGADIVTADTLCEGDPDIIKRKVQLIRTAFDTGVAVAANIGPLSGKKDEYVMRMKAAMDGGAQYLLLETFYEPITLKAALEALVPVTELPPVMLSLAPVAAYASTFDACLRMAAECPLVRYVGLNCFTDASEVVYHLQRLQSMCVKPLIAYPNAGLPDHCGVYNRNPSELASVVKCIMEHVPLEIVGGCCGTGPAHVAAIKSVIQHGF